MHPEHPALDGELQRAGQVATCTSGVGPLPATRVADPAKLSTPLPPHKPRTGMVIDHGDHFRLSCVDARKVRAVGQPGRAGCSSVARRSTRLDRGFYVQPTIFTDVRPDMSIAQEEIFGPVLSILSYDTEDEAVSIANGTIYGLASWVWSSDPNHAMSVARKIRVGQVFINEGSYDAGAPRAATSSRVSAESTDARGARGVPRSRVWARRSGRPNGPLRAQSETNDHVSCLAATCHEWAPRNQDHGAEMGPNCPASVRTARHSHPGGMPLTSTNGPVRHSASSPGTPKS
jgi:hypothetical protein